MMDQLTSYFTQFELAAEHARLLAVGSGFVGLIVIAVIANVVVKRVFVAMIRRLILNSKSTRDDILVERRVFERLSHFAPAIIIYEYAPYVLEGFDTAISYVLALSLIYMIAAGVWFINALINAGHEIYRSFPGSREIPLTSFTQVAKIIIYILGFIATVSVVMGKSPLTLFAGFGAMTAVIMLVFKDSILGFVAGIQLSANKMVAVGDWIEMPSQGIDGDIIEIALTTVKIRNFDKTITTVPTYALITNSFKNWRGMTETGGRRIKRSIHIDMKSIKFCNEEMLKRFARIEHIAEYIETRQAEVDAYNAKHDIDASIQINGRRLTNIGTFRAYVEHYLRNHPMVSKSLTLLVRQLQPTEYGLPLEIYVFSLDTNWINYEGIQADIFDHIIAAASEFDLRIFQDYSAD